MKANKAKTSKKAVKKVSKRTVKKELETSISDKFLEALKGLGHDAEKLTKEIKKASRVLANKLSDKYHEVKVAVEEKIENNKKKAKKQKKQLTSPKKAVTSSVVKAEKVVAKAVTAAKAKPSGGRTSSAGTARKVSIVKPAPKAAPAKPVSAKPAAKPRVAAARTASPSTKPAAKASTRTVKKAVPVAKKAATKATPVKRGAVKTSTALPSTSQTPAKDSSEGLDKN